jgi:hypothetical protein
MSWSIQNTHNVYLECHGPYKIHIMYTFRVMGPWLWRCTLCVFCMDHVSQCVHYVYFVWTMTLKVYIMCICMGHDTQGVHYVYFVWTMTLKVYITCILYGSWLWMCTLYVFCMGHDTQGVYYVYFVWAMTLKVYIHIMYTLRVMVHTKYT